MKIVNILQVYDTFQNIFHDIYYVFDICNSNFCNFCLDITSLLGERVEGTCKEYPNKTLTMPVHLTYFLNGKYNML